MPIEDVEKIVRKEPLEDYYDVGSELGRGKFAIVKRCTEKSTGQQFAAKVLRKRRRGKSCREEILVEIDIMRQAMDHQRIIKLHEVFESSHEFHIIIELATGGELFRVIAIEPLPEEKAREVVYQILDGVQHLHALNIVHLDLKPENILLYRKGSLDIKIADFGLAKQLKEGETVKTLVGTAEYVAPEILNFEPITTNSDMWSIGALTYALLTGYSPFQGETHQETFLNVSTCDYDFEDEVFDLVSPEAKDFIEKMLIKRPNRRQMAAKCLQHPWMKARKANLNSSTSSLDSALCMDSASSMEPSPVSSNSSSFSPAPSSTSKSGGSSSSFTTTTTNTYSQPEDMKKVNEKLSQISTLATERLVADAPPSRGRQEGSPTSTDSSTSTIKGDESAENIPALVKQASKRDPELKPLGRNEKLTKDREGTDGKISLETRARSRVTEATLKPSIERRESEKSLLSSLSKDITMERKSCTLPRLRSDRTKVADVASLDPKTVESLEKYQRIKHRGRPHTPEPVSPDVTETKLLLSADGDRRVRRKSEGMHPMAPTVDNKNFKCSEPTVMEEAENARPVTPTGRRYKTRKEREREAELLAKQRETCATPKQEPVSEERTSKAAEKPPSPVTLRRRERESQTLPSKERPPDSKVKVTVTCEVTERKRSPPAERRSPPVERRSSPLERQVSPVEQRSPSVEQRLSPVERQSSPVERRSPKPEREGSPSSRESSPFSRSLEVRKRQKSPISDHMKHLKSNRRKTPVISTDALDAILRGEIPNEADEDYDEMESESMESSPKINRRTLDTITEQTSPPRVASPTSSATVTLKGDSDQPKSPEKKAPITSALKDKSNGANGTPSGSPDKRDRRVTLSAAVTIRHKSTSDYSPERSPNRELSPSPENEPLLRSGDRMDRFSRLQRTRSLVVSRSTPDLTALLEGHTREPKKVERSNSRRRPRLDSYITYQSSYRTETPTFSRSNTISHNRGSRFFSGGGVNKAFSAFTRSSKDRKRH